MPEVRPWMRRAAEQGWRLSVEQIAQAIVAHAPPVEEMVEALKMHDPEAARDLYDSWLAKQGEANG